MRIARTGSRADLWVLAAAVVAAGVLALPSGALAPRDVPSLEPPAIVAHTYIRGPDDCPSSRPSILVGSDRLSAYRIGALIEVGDRGGERDWSSFSEALVETRRASNRRDVEIGLTGDAPYSDLVEVMDRARDAGFAELVVLTPDSLSFCFDDRGGCTSP